MKNILMTVLAVMFILCIFNNIYADEDVSFNSKEWTFKTLTEGSDQNDVVKVSKYYNYYDQSKYAFCIEPSQIYLPVGSTYETNKYSNESIFNIAKAYDAIGKDDDNYYIAAQILIWKEIEGIDYTFDNLDYNEYKEELLNYIYPKKSLLKNEDLIPQSYVGEEGKIDVDYSDYEIKSEGVEIISNSNDGITYVIEDSEPEIKVLELTPKDSDLDRSYIFKSEESQDLYYHEGSYNGKKPITLSIRTLYKPTNFNLLYSKVDTNNSPIKGAEFTLYEIGDDIDSEEIVFIKNDVDLDIYLAILGEYSSYQNISFETTERYQRYINDNIIHTKEIGYFDYKIYDSDVLIKEGRIYVTDNDELCNGTYLRINTRVIFKGYSEDLIENSINNLPVKSKFYLCESEPKKGYEYASEPCVIVDGETYNGNPYKFVNSERKYTLRLMKQSPDNIYLDGAKFRISYIDNGIENNIEYTTGCLVINRLDSDKYLIIRYENDDFAEVIEPGNLIYEDLYAKEGKYYYYESDSNIVNNSLLNDRYINVVKGGFNIEDLPYSSSLTIEELVAPIGYIITEPIYHIEPNLSYSEITFKNYRINTIDIVVPQKFTIPKTCVNG